MPTVDGGIASCTGVKCVLLESKTSYASRCMSFHAPSCSLMREASAQFLKHAEVDDACLPIFKTCILSTYSGNELASVVGEQDPKPLVQKVSSSAASPKLFSVVA